MNTVPANLSSSLPSTPPATQPQCLTAGSNLHLLGTYTSGPSGTWNYGAGNDVDMDQGVVGLGADLGKPITAINVFPVYGDQNWWYYNLKRAVDSMHSSAIAKNIVPVIGIKLFWANTAPQNYGWGDPQAFVDVAAGKFDATWIEMIDAVSDAQIPVSIFRIGYEDNFNFMPDGETGDPDTQLKWKAAFEHVAKVLRAEAFKKGVVAYLMYNPALGNGSLPVDTNLPDPSLWDILGADQYNSYWGGGDVNDIPTRVGFWHNPNGWGMDQQIALAVKLKKPMYFAETGSGPNPNGPSHGLSNDTAFWDFMADSIKSMRAQGVPMLGMNIWNIQAGDGSWQFTGGVQPAVLDSISKYIADGTFVGDAFPAMTAAPCL